MPTPLSPERLAALIRERRPRWSLPQPFYLAPEFENLDRAYVYARGWLFAGHVSQARRPGDWFTFELGGESLIVIRAADGALHAHFNVCRHRGSRICLEAHGHAKKLVCPYHQWVYEPGGRLHTAKSMPEGFDPDAFGLKPAHVAEVEGLIFVSFASRRPPFERLAADVTPYLAPHGLARARIAAAKRYDVRANWKLVVENSRECYHCPVGHPEYTRLMSPAGEDERAACERRVEGYHARGLLTRRILGDGYHVSRYPTARADYFTQSLDGKPLAPLMGSLSERDCGVLGFIVFPNLMFIACGDHAVSFSFVPSGPARTGIDALWLVREDAQEGRDYDLAKLTAFWEATGEQDWKLCEDNQAGICSASYEPGPYSDCEGDVERFVTWYLRQLEGFARGQAAQDACAAD
ncbi:MAG: aromatic ring-hydroxylating dioxygenase subunit alpha [Planctomycetota bacterium]|nr:aromatic ring-hydroxylating dioxygenase subunit alpha [Planctomycetota bacterium]